MASEIDVYANGGTVLIDTVSGTSIAGTLNSFNVFQYTPQGGSAQPVGVLVARMGTDATDDVLTIDASPPTGGSTPDVNNIRITASDIGVSSLVSWEAVAGTSTVRLSIQTPRGRNEWVLYEFGVVVPVLRLKVKIVRV